MAERVSEVIAPAPRPTFGAAVLAAAYLSVPVFVVLTAVEVWWRFR